MQGSSMLSVKQVATALGIDERSVRDKLQLGTLKGTKKMIGAREQWFVHQRDLDAELARRGQTPINHQSQTGERPATATENPAATAGQPVNYQAPPQTFGSPPQQAQDPNQYLFSTPPQGPEVTSATSQHSAMRGQSIHQASPKLTIEHTVEEDVMDATVLETFVDRSIFEDENAEVPTSGGQPRSWRNEDLEGQVMATAEKIMRPLLERVEELTKTIVLKDLEIEEKDRQLKLLPDFEAQRKKLLSEIEAERTAAEIQYNKVKEKEEEAKALEAENVLLKKKAEEAVLNAAKLADLEKVVQELQKPKPTFWQKFFGQPAE